MRRFIYEMVHIYEGSVKSVIYKYLMTIFIVASILPLTIKEKTPEMGYLEIICLIVFIIDYILRWITADYKFNNKSWTAFVKYPLRLISFVDLLSIFALLCSTLELFPNLKITQVLIVFRLIRIFRYSKSVKTILNILDKSKKPLIAVGSLAVGYIVISAIIMFNVEPDSFETFIDAVYWATISLTTVGYGDIHPITLSGRIVAMLSSFLGIAIVALPAGIVTAEYLNTIKKGDK